LPFFKGREQLKKGRTMSAALSVAVLSVHQRKIALLALLSFLSLC